MSNPAVALQAFHTLRAACQKLFWNIVFVETTLSVEVGQRRGGAAKSWFAEADCNDLFMDAERFRVTFLKVTR